MEANRNQQALSPVGYPYATAPHPNDDQCGDDLVGCGMG